MLYRLSECCIGWVNVVSAKWMLYRLSECFIPISLYILYLKLSNYLYSVKWIIRRIFQVAVVWRKEPRVIQYDYLEGGWFKSMPDLENSQSSLSQLLDWHLRSSEVLPFMLELSNDLIDEHAHVRFIFNVQRWIKFLSFYQDHCRRALGRSVEAHRVHMTLII